MIEIGTFIKNLFLSVMMSCYCPTPSKTISKGEILCCKCGVVFGSEDVVNLESQAKLSLYLRNTKGSTSDYQPEHAKKLHVHNSVDINIMSDTCGKLQLPSALEDDIWRVYQELRKMYMQRPNAAAYAIYRAVRLNDLPILDEDIIKKIQMTFQVLRVPSYLTVMSEVNKLNMVSPKSYLLTDRRRTKSTRYHLLIHVQRACKKNPHIPFDILLTDAEPRFNARLTANADTRAKRAVFTALTKLRGK